MKRTTAELDEQSSISGGSYTCPARGILDMIASIDINPSGSHIVREVKAASAFQKAKGKGAPKFGVVKDLSTGNGKRTESSPHGHLACVKFI
jgi:hypothetical protein